jgi:hypothetical protein
MKAHIAFVSPLVDSARIQIIGSSKALHILDGCAQQTEQLRLDFSPFHVYISC